MVRKIWRFIGDVRLTFWLLMVIAAVMAVGSLYALVDYQLFDRLNQMPVQQWFLSHGLGNLHLSWWLIALFILFFLFSMNLAACTIQRIAVLVQARHKYGLMKFFVLLIPSLVHVLFLFILASHLVTFTASSHHRYPLREGDTVTLPDGTGLRVGSLKHEFFPETSLLKGRVSQTSVALSWEEEGATKSGGIRFLEPLTVKGYMVSLDMQRDKGKKGMPQEPPKERELDKETCNKEQAYHLAHYQGANIPRLYAVVTRDPGIAILVPSFFAMIALMVIYYVRIGSVERS